MKHILHHVRSPSFSEGSVAVLPFNPNAQLALSPQSPFQHIEICLIPDGTAKRELSGGLQGSASRERLGSSLGHHADH